MKLTLYGRPYTKKNSPQIICKARYHKLLPSKNYLRYEADCLKQIIGKYKKRINKPINLQAIYYMPTRHIVDLVGLLQATNDILVKAEVLEDDNSRIVTSHDGSKVLIDRNNPRVEITITYKEQNNNESNVKR